MLSLVQPAMAPLMYTGEVQQVSSKSWRELHVRLNATDVCVCALGNWLDSASQGCNVMPLAPGHHSQASHSSSDQAWHMWEEVDQSVLQQSMERSVDSAAAIMAFHTPTVYQYRGPHNLLCEQMLRVRLQIGALVLRHVKLRGREPIVALPTRSPDLDLPAPASPAVVLPIAHGQGGGAGQRLLFMYRLLCSSASGRRLSSPAVAQTMVIDPNPQPSCTDRWPGRGHRPVILLGGLPQQANLLLEGVAAREGRICSPRNLPPQHYSFAPALKRRSLGGHAGQCVQHAFLRWLYLSSLRGGGAQSTYYGCSLVAHATGISFNDAVEHICRLRAVELEKLFERRGGDATSAWLHHLVLTHKCALLSAWPSLCASLSRAGTAVHALGRELPEDQPSPSLHASGSKLLPLLFQG